MCRFPFVWPAQIMDKKSMTKEDEIGVEQEVTIMGKINHPGIVKLREVFDTKHKFYMVLELMLGGELFDRIVEKEKYTENEAVGVAISVCSALQYCHDRGIVHRDLKPENLLYSTKDDDATVKIADFGLAKLLSEESLMMHTACGTPGYVAPEVLCGGGYTEAVDMWSMGVIIYILLCGFPPFYEENNAALFATIKACSFDYPSPYWDVVSPEARDLINHLLVKEPSRRLNASQVLKHKWIKLLG